MKASFRFLTGFIAVICLVCAYWLLCARSFESALEAIQSHDIIQFNAILKRSFSPNYRSWYSKNTLVHYLITDYYLNNPDVMSAAIRVFVSNGGNINAKDGAGRTVLHSAYIRHAPKESIDILIKNGADRSALDASGHSAEFYDQEKDK